jgi:hypothetical protein
MLVSDQVRLATVTPSSFRKAARKLLRRSGTKALRFVGLGLHTHRKAPAEAQTRFSEEILSLLFYRIGIDAAPPLTTGRLSTTRRTF